jgi:hypothetical protein
VIRAESVILFIGRIVLSLRVFAALMRFSFAIAEVEK